MSNIRKLERIVASLAFFLGGVLILGDKEALGLFFTLSGIFAYIPNAIRHNIVDRGEKS